MIFEELVIHNFGIYKGRHKIPLAPKSKNKPIILFGGLNGGGKTTFLDALQLTLYGKFARCSNRGTLSYEDYLRETINRHCPAKEGASLELTFSSYIDGELQTYQIKRFWRSVGKTIREDMEVIHNGVLDQVMTEQWYEYVDEFIPLSISSLFFFDGEKIEALADTEGSANLIRTGITSLLGLDIVDKLDTDLNALLRNGISSVTKQKIAPKDLAATTKKEAELMELKNRIKDLSSNLACSNTAIDNYQSEIKSLNASYRGAGGELFDRRETMVSNLNRILNDIEIKEAQLRKYAEDFAPMMLIEDLLWQSFKQAKAESKGQEIQQFLTKTKERDNTLISHLKKSGADTKSIKLVEEKLNEENNAQVKQIPRHSYLDTPVSAFSGLKPEKFNQLRINSKQINNEISVLEEQRLNANRNLAAVPEEAVIADIQQQLSDAEATAAQERAKYSVLEDQISLVKRQIEQAEIKLSNLKLAENKNSFDAELHSNITENVASVKTILNKFHHAMVEKHIKHLESLILDSFRSLIRKSNLVKKITIEPESYKITLRDQQLEPIPSNRLSAGERQILAISILWGLAKASGRPLPAIIDTPLGRLDSQHRKLLIGNYFPKASHQVILLSTDQEIDKGYRDDLSKYIGREYHIEYQESLKTSTITEGYF
ncbi:MAG: DNA sulfur modification protein DndD [Oleiphilaceae bacterium]|jgi:DNA sulfur modification protein DndD